MTAPKFAIGDWVRLPADPKVFPTPRLQPSPPLQVDEVRECPRLDFPPYFRIHARHEWRWAEGPESHFELTTPPAAATAAR